MEDFYEDNEVSSTGLRVITDDDEFAYSPQVLLKSNKFIGAKYKATAIEHKVTYLAMLKLQQRDYERKPDGLYVYLTAAEIKKETGSKSGSFYTGLKLAADAMTSSNYGIVDDENESFDFISLITRAKYEKGIFMIKFALEFESDLLNIETNFTKVPKSLAMNFKCVYTYPLYQVLRQQCYYPKDYHGPRNYKFVIEMGLSELKLTIGVVNANQTDVKRILRQGTGTTKDYDKAVKAAENSKEAMFKAWNDMDFKCLRPTIKEINELTEMDVGFEPIKAGRGGKVVGVRFIVWLYGAKKTNQNKDIPGIHLDENENVVATMSDNEKFPYWANCMEEFKNYKIQFTDAQAICEAACYDEDEIKRAHSLLNLQSKTINNPVGWIIDCIKNKYQTNSYSPEKKTKHNFNQREYDVDEFEKMLLTSSIQDSRD